jgi:ubiquinone/menaquinone biosynthesis C-methylase UbiE
MFRRRRTEAALRPSNHGDWRSFGSVAEAYDRVRTPVHEAPARDLVALVAPPPGGRVLDVGTGTGVAAVPALEAVGPHGLVVGIDPAVEMLRLARSRGISRVAGAEAIDLPFRVATFDTVLANFVIFILTRYDTALFDMVRVLRPGGSLGVTTWAGREDEFTRTWREVAESFATKEMLEDARRKAMPWEDHFSQPSRLDDALRAAGLRPVRIEQRSYRSSMSIESYLAGRETGAMGRFLRHLLGETLWERFRSRVEEEFRTRFADPLGDTSEVLLGVGAKP